MKNIYIPIAAIVAFIFLVQACSKLEPKASKEDALLDGPVEGLSFEQSQRFQNRDATFNDEVLTIEKGRDR